MITCKYSVFLSALFTFFHSLIPVDYLRCSESTQSFCLLFSHLSSLQGNTDFRPSWPQPACFLITLMSETCKDIISLKCLLLVGKKKQKKTQSFPDGIIKKQCDGREFSHTINKLNVRLKNKMHP